MARLRGDDKHGEVVVRVNCLEPLHYLEPIHHGHLKIKQDQVVAVLQVEFVGFAGIRRRRDGIIAGTMQHSLEKLNISLQIVNNQNLAVKNIR